MYHVHPVKWCTRHFYLMTKEGALLGRLMTKEGAHAILPQRERSQGKTLKNIRLIFWQINRVRRAPRVLQAHAPRIPYPHRSETTRFLRIPGRTRSPIPSSPVPPASSMKQLTAGVRHDPHRGWKRPATPVPPASAWATGVGLHHLRSFCFRGDVAGPRRRRGEGRASSAQPMLLSSPVQRAEKLVLQGARVQRLWCRDGAASGSATSRGRQHCHEAGSLPATVQ